jgi:hypothetical protein
MLANWSRRQFIGVATLGTSGLAMAKLFGGCKPGTQVPEISASVFPWDLADEGMEKVLDNLQEMAGVNSVYLCNLSEEVRPFRGGEYTHNPVRKSYKCEDSHIYWPPDKQYYGKIQPLRTQRDFLAGTDWVGEFIKATGKRGMKSGVEFFHGFIDQDRLENQFPDSMQVDIHGDPVLTHNYNKPASCLNSPDFQEYAVGLYSDLSANYEPDYIQTCMIPYVLPTWYLVQNLPPDPIKWALIAPQKGGCFCSHCMAAAEAKGFDLENSRKELLELARQDNDAILDSGITAMEYLYEYPVLKQWLDFRCDSVNNLYSQISKTSKALQAGIDIRWNNYVRTHGYYSGIDLPSFMNHIDSIRANAFVEHEDDPALVDEKIEHLNHFNEIVQDRVHWVAALDIRGRNPAVLERSAELSSFTGCDGYALSHYGGATLENLRAVRRGLQKSKWAEHF